MTVRPLPDPVRVFFPTWASPRLEDALTLLRTGRADLALQVLERLPATIGADRQAALAEADASHRMALAAALTAAKAAHQAALAEANARTAELRREVERLRRELARPQHKHPRMLATALADGRTTPERVAELLKIRSADVTRIAEGRVGLSGGAWQRVLTEIAV